jgi:hypothetical protein
MGTFSRHFSYFHVISVFEKLFNAIKFCKFRMLTGKSFSKEKKTEKSEAFFSDSDPQIIFFGFGFLD